VRGKEINWVRGERLKQVAAPNMGWIGEPCIKDRLSQDSLQI